MISIPNRAAEFREAFAQQKWLMDGAMATMLFAKGASSQKPVEELNLTLAALVRDVHREYLAAGAEILRTNTFGANRIRLSHTGLGAKLADINRAAVRIARTVAGSQAFIAGTIGPTGVRLAPLGSLTEEEARGVFRQQAGALAGVDLFVLETFRDVAELRAAVDGVREAVGSEIVIVAHLSVEDAGHLQDGTPPERYGAALNELAADAVGINCSRGPYAVFGAMSRMWPHVQKPLTASPGAGFPVACSPEYFAKQPWNVQIAGGCCGTTPEHIRQLRSALTNYPDRPAKSCPPVPQAEPHVSGDYETIVQVTARGRSASTLQRDLIAAHALGTREILCLTGDGTQPLDIDSIGLTYIASCLNQGRDFGGNPAPQTAFKIGVRANPNARDIDHEIARFEAKVRAGAHFAIAQPVFDISLFEAFLNRIEPFAIPLIASVWIVTDSRLADYVVNELDIPIPQPVLDRIAAGEGHAVGEDLAKALRPIRAGIRTLH